MAGIFTHRLGVVNPAAGGGATDPHFASTILLLGFEGADGATTSADESAAARGSPTFRSTAQLDTAQFKYGASSLLLNGSSDYVDYGVHSDWDIGTAAFTIEMWIRFNAVASNIAFIGNRDSGARGWRFTRESGGIRFNAGGSGTIGTPWTPSTGQWYHICADREAAGPVRVYVDGTMLQKGGDGTAPTASSLGLFIGRFPSAASGFHNGWIDEVRYTKGVARYASDGGFTVPAAAYPRS